MKEELTASIRAYWRSHPDYAREACASGVDVESGVLPIRGVLFDMDGVLFNSMPFHATAWAKVCNEYGLAMTEEDVYLHEGRTGFSTINCLTTRQWGRETTEEEVAHIYALKCVEFNKFPEAEKMPGAHSLLEQVKASGRKIGVVTGSGQESLLERLGTNFPGIFCRERVTCSHDYTKGKPNPEPYLMGLQKLGLRPWETLVVENAPLGIRAAVAAGMFTIAANTGPLADDILLAEGAGLLFPSMQALSDAWAEIERHLQSEKMIE